MEHTRTQPEMNQSVQEQGQPLFQPPKKKKKWIRRVVIALALLAVLLFAVVRPMMSAGQQLLATVYLSHVVELRDMTVQVSSTGTVTPVDSYRVTGQAAGEVLEAPFEEGERVEKGQLLYRLDAGDTDISVRRSQLSVDQAQLSYDAQLENTRVNAGSDGVVQKLHVAPGDTVSVGSPIADIRDAATMLISIPFHSADAAELRPGQQGVLTVEGSLDTLTGTIRSISGAVEVGEGGVLLRRVEFSTPNPGALTDATTATAMVGEIACAQPGTFRYRVEQTVTARTSGEIAALHVSEGDRVARGDLLAQLGGTAVETALENARINLENARLGLESARNLLDNYEITSPISGTVVVKNFKAGDMVDSSALSSAGGSMAIIYDMSALTFEMKISELDINKIRPGQAVKIFADAVEDVTFDGVVDHVSISGTTVSGMTDYPVTVEILNPGDLKPGMNVSADVIVEHVGQVLAVPVEAVKRGEQAPYVLVAPAQALDEQGAVTDPTALERREVTLGRNDSGYIEITQGLSQGETVVWENQASNPLAALMGM